MAKQINCEFCGADYDEMQAACPFCGTMNPKGAEAQYMGKLEDVRLDVEDLGSVPGQETRKEIKKLGKFLRNIFIVIGIAVFFIGVVTIRANKQEKRNPQEDYAWQKENFPIFDELYEKGDYDQLTELYEQAVLENRPIFEWEHDDFVMVYDNLYCAEEILERLKAGEELSDTDYMYLIYYGWKFDGTYMEEHLTEQEMEMLRPRIDYYLQDFYTRWEFTEEERAAFVKDREERYGHPSFELSEKYIKKWKKEK